MEHTDMMPKMKPEIFTEENSIVAIKEDILMSVYEERCLSTWGGEERLIRSFLGIAGEAGETSEALKKYMRGDFDLETLKERVVKELGDVLYYVTVCANELGFSLSDIAILNNKKLADRQSRNVILGDGNDR